MESAKPSSAPLSDGEILKQQSARRSSAGSPVEMEATLADISDEVTTEAIERLAFEAQQKLVAQKKARQAK